MLLQTAQKASNYDVEVFHWKQHLDNTRALLNSLWPTTVLNVWIASFTDTFTNLRSNNEHFKDALTNRGYQACVCPAQMTVQSSWEHPHCTDKHCAVIAPSPLTPSSNLTASQSSAPAIYTSELEELLPEELLLLLLSSDDDDDGSCC